MEDKNSILKENNRLLLDKMSPTTSSSKAIQPQMTCIQTKIPSSATHQKRAATLVIDKGANIQIQKKDTENNVNTKTSVNTAEEKKPEDNVENDGFIYQGRRKSRRNSRNLDNTVANRPQNRTTVKRQIGKAKIDGNQDFRGVEPKVWMYLYRVIPKVSENNIQEYMKTKLGEKENISVRELKNGNNPRQCFMVAANFEHKDKLYDPEFWPAGVGFRRFDFKKVWEYKEQENINQNSFLM